MTSSGLKDTKSSLNAGHRVAPRLHGGRTLDDSFIILDEAQTQLRSRMKMFLTRLGLAPRRSPAISARSTCPREGSGLIEAQQVLSGIEGLEFVYLGDRDVVPSLVQKIVKAYERYHILQDMKKAGSRTILDGQESKLA